MARETKHINLSDLRSETVDIKNEIVFEKSLFGGYNPKAVSEYISVLKDSLLNAERLFNNRLEEYAAMVDMLTQERDKYLGLLTEKEQEIIQLQQNTKMLKTQNDELNQKSRELSENILDQEDLILYENTFAQNVELKNKIEDLENSITQYEEGKADHITLLATVEQLESTIQEQNTKIENYAKNEITKKEYDSVLKENERLTEQYDQAMSEMRMLSVEKNVLEEQNNRLADRLITSDEKNKELREENTKINLKTKKIMAGFETKIYECSQNHKQNIDQITYSLKNALQILNYENLDIAKLLKSPDEDIFIEDEAKKDQNLKEES